MWLQDEFDCLMERNALWIFEIKAFTGMPLTEDHHKELQEAREAAKEKLWEEQQAKKPLKEDKGTAKIESTIQRHSPPSPANDEMVLDDGSKMLVCFPRIAKREGILKELREMMRRSGVLMGENASEFAIPPSLTAWRSASARPSIASTTTALSKAPSRS